MLQYSGLKNSMDCIVHGVAKSQTQLSNFHSTPTSQGLLLVILQVRLLRELTKPHTFWFELTNLHLTLVELVVKNPSVSAGNKRCGFDPCVSKISWRTWQLTPVFWPGESRGQGSLVGYSPQGHKESDTTEVTQHSILTQELEGTLHTDPNTGMCPRSCPSSDCTLP